MGDLLLMYKNCWKKSKEKLPMAIRCEKPFSGKNGSSFFERCKVEPAVGFFIGGCSHPRIKESKS